MLVLGVIALAVAALLLYLGLQAKKKLALVEATPTFQAEDLQSVPTGVAVEVTGTLRCEAPLTGPLSSSRCAYYSTKKTLEYEVVGRDSEGKEEIRRGSEVLESDEQMTAFPVEDATGTVRVVPRSAEVDMAKTVDRFDDSPQERWGWTRNLGDRRTLGHKYEEWILPLDGRVFVLGMLYEHGLIAAPPPDRKDVRFLISRGSEAELGHSLANQARWLSIASYALLAIGALLLVLGIVR